MTGSPTLETTSDFADEELDRTDRRRLRSIVAAITADRELLLEISDATIAIERLKIAAGLDR